MYDVGRTRKDTLSYLDNVGGNTSQAVPFNMNKYYRSLSLELKESLEQEIDA